MSALLPLDQITSMREKVQRLNMVVPVQFSHLTDADLRLVCNGIGPEMFPAFLREATDDVLGRFLAASMPHDVAYDYAQGTRAHWHLANAQFHTNCILSILDVPRGIKREALMRTARLLYDAVESPAGWEAYIDAYRHGPTCKEVK